MAEIKLQANALFEGDKLSTIFDNLNADGGEFATKMLKTLSRMSPTSLAITFEQLKRGKHLSFENCMKLEMRLAYHIMQAPDFYEGVRALLLDKDKNPKWQPAKLADVTKEMIKGYFAIIDNELTLDWENPVEQDK